MALRKRRLRGSTILLYHPVHYEFWRILVRFKLDFPVFGCLLLVFYQSVMCDSFVVFAKRDDVIRIMILLKRESLGVMIDFRRIFASRERAFAAIFLLKKFFDPRRDVPF